MDRETAVYHFYLRKKNTDLFRKQKTKDKEWTNRHQSTTPTSESRRQTKDNGWRLRTRSGQRYGSLPLLLKKRRRHKTRSQQTNSSLPLLLKKAEDTRQGVNRPTAVYHSYLRSAEDTRQGVNRPTAVYHSYLRRQKTQDKESTDQQQSTTPT